MNAQKKQILLKGMRDGVPIGLGYFAVAFSLGIIAGKAGLTAPMGFFASLFTRASAGEYGVYSLILINATYLEVFVISLIANLRYLLMNAALTQKFKPTTSLFNRLLVGACCTDEIFGVSIAYPGFLEPIYTYGACIVAAPMWAMGTCAGIIAGDVLPTNIVSALSVALYGMFIAIIIPAGKKDKAVLVTIIVSFAASYICGKIPGIKNLSSGLRTIILTIGIAALAALIRPISEEEVEEKVEEKGDENEA